MSEIFDEDLFEDIRTTEARMRKEFTQRLAVSRQALALAEGILQLESSAGFKHLQTTLSDLLEARTKGLLSAREDRDAAVLQGRCLELREILSLMKRTREKRDALASGIQDEEDRFRELERSFKPQGNS